MSARHRTQAIVLKNTNFREQDKIISFYTKEFGRIEVLGKSIRKKKAKLRSFVQYPYFLEIDFIQGKNHKILTDAVLLNDFSVVRKNLSKISIAYKLSFLLQHFIREPEKDEKVWFLLSNSLLFLNKEDFSAKRSFFLYYYFLWNLLSFLGYRINLDRCSLCQKKISKNPSFSLEKGLTHFNCFEGKSISFELIDIFKKMEKNSLEIINEIDLKWKKSFKYLFDKK